MDPNANLKAQREIVKKLLDGNTEQSLFIHYAVQLAELVQALDQWMSRGGFLPEAWARGRNILPTQ